MARIPEDFLHTLLDRVDIVGVVERYVPLKKAGANFQARCPFHNEKTPSFTVSPTKQFYHCFGCGAHGTAITFLMEHGGMGFVDAVRELAGQVGLQVPLEESGDHPREDEHRESLAAVLETAARFYRGELKESREAVTYLKGRALTGQTAARFGLGYAPDDWQGLARCFADYQDEALERSGLVIAGESGKRYDRFRGRVMFPIRNDRGRIIAFGGRIFGAGEPKYLNSPETPLFHKGRELYGLFEHRRAIQQSAEVLVVEGYMDVVMLAQHGITNAVATLGTAVTPEQVKRLFRLADSVIFAFDGDAAGRKAAWRALENALPQLLDGKRAAFLFFPEGEDPDSYVRSQGAEGLRRLTAQALPLSDYLLRTLAEQTNPDSEEGRVRLAKQAEGYLRQMVQAPLLARALRNRLVQMTGLPLAAPTAIRPAPQAARQSGRVPRLRPSPWRTLLLGILQDPARAVHLPALPDAEGREAELLSQVLAVLRESPRLSATRDVVEAFRGRPEQGLLEQAAADILLLGETYDAEADMQGALRQLHEQARRREVEALLSRKKLSDLSPEERESIRSLKLEGPPLVKPPDVSE